MKVCSIAAVTLFSIVLAASTVCAQEPSEVDLRERRARVHFDSATAHFEMGAYESALEGYRAAYAESPHPELLYNIFLCEERLGNLAAAVEALEGYLASERVPNRPVLERRLAHLRERRARGETRIDDAPAEVAAPAEVGAPSDAQVEPGEVVTEVPVVPPPSRDDTLAIAGFSVAAVGLVGFAIGGGITLAEDASLRDTCAPICSSAQLETIGIARVIGDISAGVALAGAIVGVVGLVMAPGESEPTTAGVRVRGLGLEGTF